MVPGAAARCRSRCGRREEYEAALSYVPIEPVEDDLFAGLPDVAAADAMATKGDLQIAYDGRKDPS